MIKAPLTEAQARTAMTAIAMTQTAYALNNGGGIVLNQPLVYIDDRTTAGRPGWEPLNLSIPSGFVVVGIFKDRSEPSKNTGADMYVAYNPATREVGIGIAGTNGVGHDLPDTRSDIALMGADQAAWLAKNGDFRSLISELGDKAEGVQNLRFIVGGDSLSGVAAILVPTALVFGLPGKNGEDPTLGLDLKASQFSVANVNPLGANYAANYLGMSDKVKEFGESAFITNFAVYNPVTGYDIVSSSGGSSPGDWFRLTAAGGNYESTAGRHQMNLGVNAGLKAISGDLTKAERIEAPPQYTHESASAVMALLAAANFVENNIVSLTATGFAAMMLSVPGETAASAAKYLRDNLGMPDSLAAAAGIFIEGAVRVGSMANLPYAIGTFLTGLLAGKAIGSSAPVLPTFPKVEDGYTRAIFVDPNSPFVGAVDTSNDNTILRYTDGSTRTYDIDGHVSLKRPDGTTSFRNADGDGVLRMGGTGTTVLLDATDRIDILPYSVVRITSNGDNGATILRDYSAWTVTTHVGTYGTNGAGVFTATQPAIAELALDSADALYADANYQNLDSMARGTGMPIEALIKANPMLSLDMSLAPGTKVALPAINTFALSVDPVPSSGQAAWQGATDPITQTAQVNQGLISSGSGWKLSADAGRLNENQFQFGAIDNTSSAAYTQILSDDFRPGNGNLAQPVINPSLYQLGSGFHDSSPDILGSWLNTGRAQAQFTWPTDPLVLDLDGDGVRLTDYLSAPVLFDIDNDGGSLEQTGWVSAADGMVALDRNGNGRIDNSSELLSEYFGGAPGSDGNAGAKPYANGFVALASLDSNHDHVFDSHDDAWHEVRVWVDANHDGLSWVDADGDRTVGASERTELRTFEELGISRIDLANEVQSGEVRDGNEVLARGSFVHNGTVREALAANFLANPLGSTSESAGTGTVVQTGEALRAYVAGSAQGEVIDVSAKGVTNAAGGAGRDTLIGDSANNWLSGGTGSDRFDAGGGDDVLLIDADDLQSGIHAGAGMDIVQVVGSRGVTLNLARAEVEIAQGGAGRDVFIGGGRSSVFLRGGDGDDILVGGLANDALAGENGDDYIDGAAGNDVLRGGRGADALLGDAGDDLLDGGMDDDELTGGSGNDILIGGSGDDRVDGGDGTDVIQFTGSFGDYRISKAGDGIWISDTVAGRDGTDFVRNVEKASFSDIGLVDIPNAGNSGLTSPLPVKDVLDHDGAGAAFGRSAPHLINSSQLLANDISFQGDALKISALYDVTGGTATLTAAGDVLFTPDAGYTGIMGFKYGVSDMSGKEATNVVDTGTGETAPMRAAVYLRTPELPRDPLVTDQWYLSAANILPVWKDYSGAGVRIGQFEPGGSFATTKEVLDYRHPDLKANIDPVWLANATPGQLAGEGSQGRFSNHATLVAGVMVAANNGEGGVGVAYGASVAGYWLSAEDLSALDFMREYDVVNNSWGTHHNFSLRFVPATLGMLAAPFADAVRLGRDGLGTVIVNAGGNEREAGGNTNYSNVSNSRSGIVVGAINAKTDLGALQLGSRPFSNPGASILVSAPGSNVTSTAQLLRNASGSSFGADAQTAQGTSFATPIVSGIVALMLEANPALGYRDVQQILSLSATRVDDPNTRWASNGATTWNGGGMHVSHDYGYGEVDARAAVRLAETWITQQTAANERSLTLAPESGALNLAIPDGSDTGIASTLRVHGAPVVIEHVEVLLNLTHANAGDLVVRLRSPSGTTSVLMDRPGKAPDAAADRGDAAFFDANKLQFVLDSALLRGESPEGEWTLEVIDSATGSTGTLESWSMNVFGAGATAPLQYVYTDEYAQLSQQAGRNRLMATPGSAATINAAAISSGSRIDLAAGTATLAGAALAIVNPGDIANAIGGEFDDTLTGNAGANLLMGGRGNDMLNGGDGADTLDGGAGSDTLTGGDGNDLFVIRREYGAVDVIVDASVAGDTIALVGFGAHDFAGLDKVQLGDDVRLDLGDGQTLLLRGQQLSALGADQFRFFQDSKALLQWQSAVPAVPLAVGQIDGTSADDELSGTAGADYLRGMGGNDFIDGGEGDDVLSGGTGQDFLVGGDGDDILLLEGQRGGLEYAGDLGVGLRIGGAGNDRFVLMPGGGGSKRVSMEGSYMMADNLIADFDVGHDRIDLSRFASLDNFNQLQINKALSINGKFFTRVSATVNDTTVSVALSGVEPALLDAASFIFAGSPDATVLPGEAAHAAPAGAPPMGVALFRKPAGAEPVLAGTDAADTLTGDAGGNLIDGGKGADIMEGRSGDDTYLVDSLNDRVVEVAGAGYDLVRSSVSHTLDKEVESLALEGDAASTGIGNALDNRIKGNRAANLLDGGAGADTLLGGNGDDVYIVDDSADRVVESFDEGRDTVHSSVSFTLGANLEDLELSGMASINGTGNALANTLLGNARDNVLRGGVGNDLLRGRGGDDLLIGGAGDDSYRFGAGDGRDIIIEDLDPAGGVNTIVLDAGIGIADVKLDRVEDGLLLRLASGESLRASWSEAASGGIAAIAFADGTVWRTDEIGQRIGQMPVGFGALRDQLVSEDQALRYTLPPVALTRADGTMLALSATLADGTPMPAWLRFDADTRTFMGTPDNDAVGVLQLKVSNQDASQSLQITVANTNDAPVLQQALTTQQADEDTPFTYALPAGAFADVDAGDKLGYTARLANGDPLPAWLRFDAAHATFSGTPGAAEVGALSLLVTATDAAGASVEGTFSLDVRHVNHAPRAAIAVADQKGVKGEAFKLVLAANAFTDADAGDLLGYTATLAGGGALPAWLSFDAKTRTFTGTPTDTGKLAVRVSVSDGAGGSADMRFDIEVAAPVFTGPPVPSLPGMDGTANADTMNGTPGQDIMRGMAGDDTLYGNGGDDKLHGEVGADSLYGGNGNDTLDGGAGNDRLDGGRGNDTYQMYRGMGQDTIDDFDYTAGNTDTLQIAAGISVDQLWFRKTVFRDLEIGIIGTSDSMTVRSWDFWSKGSSWENAQRIEQFRLADGTLLLDSQVDRLVNAMAPFTPPPAGQSALGTAYEALRATVLAIASENHAPILSAPLAGQTAFQGQPFSLSVAADTFKDVDADDVLRYAATTADGKPLPAWLSFDPATRLFTGTPSLAEPLEVRIIATDSHGGSASSVFTITVAIPPVVLTGTEMTDVLRGKGGNDTLSGKGGNDLLYGEAGADKLYGGDGDDMLDGGAGNDSLDGGRGNDTYQLYRGMGRDTVDDFDYTPGNTDTLQIAAGISVDQLWFRKSGFRDLEVGIVGTNDSMTVSSWDFWSKGSSWENAQHIEQIKLADGQLLLDSQVNQLVQAMASFAPPSVGQTTLPPDYQTALAPVLAANWK